MKCTKCRQEVLKVGDRVEAIGKVAGLSLAKKIGVVKAVTNNPKNPVLVEFSEKFSGGHFLRCKDKWVRYGKHEDFKIIKAEKRG